VRVPSLDVPESASSVDVTELNERLIQSDSVRLFLDRCGPSEWKGAPPTSELRAIGSICRRLDGIPLAIELAAARMTVLSAVEIEARLENRFALLAGGSRSLPRHQTLRAAIEWSWDLLSDAESALLARLSVFRGGCSLEAVEAVLAEEGAETSALDLVASLIDRSLIYSTKSEGGTRFSMLETIREFAAERLRESKEYHDSVDRHRDYFLELAEAARTLPNNTPEAVWFARLEADHDNLRAALDWSLSRSDSQKALRLVVALGRFWDTHGHLTEGRVHLREALRHTSPDSAPNLVADAHVTAGWMATVQRDCQEARDHFEEALPVFREAGDDRNAAKVLNCLATAYHYAGEYDNAKQRFEESLVIYRSLGLGDQAATVLNNLGDMALFRNDCDAARVYFEQSVVEGGGPESGKLERRGLTLCNLSGVDFRQGRHEEARTHALLALTLFWEASFVVHIPGTFSVIAVLAAWDREWERAAHLLGASESLAATHGVVPADLLETEREAAMATVCEAMGQMTFQTALNEGKRMTMEEAVAVALAFTSRPG
jgi:predicted ATPase